MDDNEIFLMNIIERLYNELRDPIGERWCDRPDLDRGMLEALVTYIEDKLGWGDE